MIFVTVGSMMPFDRLIKAVDELAPALEGETFVAQIGNGSYLPRNMAFHRMLKAEAFRTAVQSSKLIVAHAGMGTVITAMEANRPVALLPRRTSYGEVNTDHQVATAAWLAGKPGIFIASDESQLSQAMDRALRQGPLGAALASTAPPAFLARIRQAIS